MGFASKHYDAGTVSGPPPQQTIYLDLRLSRYIWSLHQTLSCIAMAWLVESYMETCHQEKREAEYMSHWRDQEGVISSMSDAMRPLVYLTS